MTTYKVTISAGDGGSVSPDGEIEVPAATDVWIFASPEQGRKVAEWYHNGQPWGCDVSSYVVPGIAADAAVHVTFAPITHEVTTTPCEGGESSQGSMSPCSSLDSGPIRVAHGQPLTLTAHPAAGFVVGAWSVDGRVVARATGSYTLPAVSTDHTVSVAFDLAPLAPVAWRGTVTLDWKRREAPKAKNTTRTADIVLTQADVDNAGAPEPVLPVPSGSERHRDVRTERVAAVIQVGPATADGRVGTIDLWRHDLVQHVRTQQVRSGVPARRRRVTHTYTRESYPRGTRQGADPDAQALTEADASVSVSYDDGQWRLAVLLAPPVARGEQREGSVWTVSGQDRPAPEPIATPIDLTTAAFEQRLDTGVTQADAATLKGRRVVGPGQVTVAWALRLDSR